ncbi:MAG: GH3 auxin-responsive promoter family protein [Anaerolineae bacterium]|nr:GH3 auxin-responsive promoter family protein [Anaerolineae bacterium]
MKEKWFVWFSALVRQIMSTAGYALRLRFEQQTRRARNVRQRTLKRILRKNQNTEFGRSHHFAEILAGESLADRYRDAVPLSHYGDYEAAIQRMQAGETNILAPGPMVGLIFTSGTTGPAKLIPKMPHQQRFGMIYGMLSGILASSPALKTRGMLGKGISLMGYVRPRQPSTQEIPMSTATGGGMQSMSAMIPYLWCSPPEVFSLEDMAAARYLHALYGLRDRNAQYILAVFASYVLQWLMTLEQRWDELVRDIEQGTLTENLNLPPDVRASLAARLSPDPARAAELRQIAAGGFVGIAPRIWPHMTRIGTVITGSFAVNVPAIRAYVGDIPFCGAMYAASEGTIGISLQPNSDEYILAPDSAYFEFLPIAEADKEQPQTVLPDALTIGESYEVVMTTYNGFYRYRMGDIVQIAGYYHESPKLIFVRRKSVELDLIGEKSTEVHLNTAVSRMAETWLAGSDLRLRDYTFALDIAQNPGRYVLYFELTGSHVPVTPPKPLDEAVHELDRNLCDANPALDRHRRNARMSAPQIKWLKPGSFDLLHEALFAHNPGGNYNQVKIPRHLKDTQLVELLDGQVLETSNVT